MPEVRFYCLEGCLRRDTGAACGSRSRGGHEDAQRAGAPVLAARLAGLGVLTWKNSSEPLAELRGAGRKVGTDFYQGFLQQDKRGWFESEEGWIEISYIRFFFFFLQ